MDKEAEATGHKLLDYIWLDKSLEPFTSRKAIAPEGIELIAKYGQAQFAAGRRAGIEESLKAAQKNAHSTVSDIRNLSMPTSINISMLAKSDEGGGR